MVKVIVVDAESPNGSCPTTVTTTVVLLLVEVVNVYLVLEFVNEPVPYDGLVMDLMFSASPFSSEQSWSMEIVTDSPLSSVLVTGEQVGAVLPTLTVTVAVLELS